MNRRSFIKGAAVSVLSLALGATGALLPGCSSGQDDQSANSESDGQAVELQIFAANSLEKAMTEVQELYTSINPNITFKDSQFKGSGDLVEMLVGGASADILITASTGTMDSAEAYIVPETRVTMFGNDLHVCAAEDSNIKINDLTDLRKDKIKRIGIGDPALVPAGKYANQSLYNASSGDDKLYSSAEGEGGNYGGGIEKKIVVADKVGTCATWAASGNVDVSFVYNSDLTRYEGVKSIYAVPEDLHKVIIYPGAVINDSQHQDEANEFLRFCMTDPDALKIWQENGFELK